MRLGDTVIGGALLTFAAVLAGYAQTFPDIPGQAYGAAVFPTAVAIGLAGCAALLIVGGIRAGHKHYESAEWMLDRRAILSVLATVVAIIGYIYLSPIIGFIPVMAVMLFALLLMLRVNWMLAIVVAIVATIVIDGLFAGVLLVPLPIGLFPRIPW